MRLRRVLPLSAGVLLAVAGCGGSGGKSSDTSSYHAAAAAIPAHGAPPWPAPPNPLIRTRAAGLQPERREQLAYHVHAHLDVFVNGRPVTVPPGIGIDISDPGVRRGPGPSYGGIQLCAHPCISPLHTHDPTGVLHTESATATPNRLGQLFVEWGVRLDPSCVGGFCRPAPIAFFVDGRRYTGDPRSIALSNKREIAVVIGSPPSTIPSSTNLIQ
jgi:hypothetical protein